MMIFAGVCTKQEFSLMPGELILQLQKFATWWWWREGSLARISYPSFMVPVVMMAKGQTAKTHRSGLLLSPRNCSDIMNYF